MKFAALAAAVLALAATSASAQTLVSPTRFNADPSPHVFNGRVYVYATDDASSVTFLPGNDLLTRYPSGSL